MSDTLKSEDLAPSSVASRSSIRRRFGLGLAVLVIVGLLASLVTHLLGRARYAEAAERFEEELGAEVSRVEPAAVLAQIATFAPEAVPDVENAAQYLMAGAQAIVWGEGEMDLVRALLRTPTGQWTPGDEERLRSMIERNRGGLETMARAIPLEGSDYGIDYGNVPDIEVPNLLSLMNAGLVLGLEARVAFADGDPERGMAALETLARLNHSLRREALLISFLIAHVTEKTLLRGVTEVLASSEPWARDPEILERLGEILPEEDLLALGRKIIAIDAAVVSAATLEGWADKFFDGAPEPWLSRYLTGHRRAADYLDLGRAAASTSHQPQTLLHEDIHGAADPETPEGLGSAYRKAVAKGQLAMSQRRLVATALELRRLGLERGAYPDPCPDLATLREPDPFVGEPLRCEPRADGSLELRVPAASSLVKSLSLHETFWVLAIDLPAPPAPSPRIG